MNKIPRPPVGADDAMEHTTPAHCRGRFIGPPTMFPIHIISLKNIIAPTADLSAFCDYYRTALSAYPNYSFLRLAISSSVVPVVTSSYNKASPTLGRKIRPRR